jgi:hypothetical protein
MRFFSVKIRYQLTVLLGALCVYVLDTPLILAAQPEYVLKAAFIEKFTRFIEWPEHSSVNDVSKPFELCVIGNNPFGKALTKLSRLATIKDKPIHLNNVYFPSQIRQCNLLFISRSVRHGLERILDQTRGRPILTVGDTPGYAESGVIINFYTELDRIGFEVNLDSANSSGFELSSRLLKLARIVGPEDGER